jgi:hypothetical protein
MLTKIKEDLSGTLAPVLRADLLRRVHALNADYLELLAAEHEASGRAAQLQYFSPKLQTALAQLHAPTRDRIARAPYALYSLCFEDVRFWQVACAPASAALEARYVANSSLWLQGPFCEVALIYAWQTASAHPMAARMLYSMSAPVCEVLTATPLWQIKQIAGDYPGLLIPRWPSNPVFWPELLRLASLEDPYRLAAAQLLGLQLISAELIAASSRGGSAGPFSGRSRASAPVARRHLHLRLR